MSDDASPSAYAIFIALAVVLGLIVLGLVMLLVTVLIGWQVFATSAPITAPLETPIAHTAAVNRLAVIDGDRIYTMDSTGADRIELPHNGSVPTAALVWSRDGQRLIFVEIERDTSKLISARPTGQDAAVLHETDRPRAPFYLYGSPDDRHVAFLTPDPGQGMALRIAPIDRAGAEQVAARGQPNYWSWSPDGSALLVHIGSASSAAFVGQYVLTRTLLTTIEQSPAVFQAPAWLPAGEAQWVYARSIDRGGELVVGHGRDLTSLAIFADGITFGSSPDGRRVAYALNTPGSFLYNGLTVIDRAGTQPQVLYRGDVLAFFWSPDGQQIAFLTGALMEPGSIGRAGGLAVPSGQRRTLQATWHIVNVTSGAVTDLNTFEPSQDFLYVIQYFDQFAQSIALWSPDSRWLVHTGHPLVGAEGVYLTDTREPVTQPTYLGPGDFAIWSWK
jgi:Tol biopolymer transport system component